MANAAPVTGNFDIGRVFSRTFSLIGGHWQVLVPIAIGVAVISALMSGWLMTSMIAAIEPGTNGGPGAEARALGIFTSPAYWGTIIVSFLLNSFSVSAMLSALLNRSDGGIAGAMGAGLQVMLPMLGLTILWALGFGLGWVLLVVPGLILLTMWSVSAPALVAERTGVIAAFGRSRALTKGFRWSIFATLVLFGVVYFILVFMVGGGSGVALGMAAQTGSMPDATSVITQTVISGGLGTLFTIIMNAFLAALYLEVLNAKEGEGSDQLADVFS
jgi:hypothetical protein